MRRGKRGIRRGERKEIDDDWFFGNLNLLVQRDQMPRTMPRNRAWLLRPDSCCRTSSTSKRPSMTTASSYLPLPLLDHPLCYCFTTLQVVSNNRTHFGNCVQGFMFYLPRLACIFSLIACIIVSSATRNSSRLRTRSPASLTWSTRHSLLPHAILQNLLSELYEPCLIGFSELFCAGFAPVCRWIWTRGTIKLGELRCLCPRCSRCHASISRCSLRSGMPRSQRIRKQMEIK